MVVMKRYRKLDQLMTYFVKLPVEFWEPRNAQMEPGERHRGGLEQELALPHGPTLVVSRKLELVD